MTVSQFKGSYRFLSNFWPAKVRYEGVDYPTVEHAYQAAKTLDLEVRKQFAGLEPPSGAKRLGRKLEIRPDWDRIKLLVMEDLVRQKFQHPELRDLLLATESRELQEGNTWGDRFWGIFPPVIGYGENHLGKILMRVRAELQGAEIHALIEGP